jgi:hypothetical protein
MPNDPNLEPPRPEAPFVLELRHEDVQPSGDFTPSAAVLVTDSLRSGGLLQAMDAEEFQTLLLSCVTANGGFAATPELLAPVAGVPTYRMLGRLRRLASLSWRGEPILMEQGTESGLRLFQPSPHLLAVRRSLVFPALERAGEPLAIPLQIQESGYGTGGQGAAPIAREAVIAYSRAKYGRPRAEVEATIERFLRGEPEPTTSEEEARLLLRRRLTDTGLTGEQADRLLDAFPSESIEQQLGWLPYRRARNPAGLLLAAIEGNYEAPPGARRAWHTDAEDDFGGAEIEEAAGNWDAPEVTEGTAMDLPLPEIWPDGGISGNDGDADLSA